MTTLACLEFNLFLIAQRTLSPRGRIIDDVYFSKFCGDLCKCAGPKMIVSSDLNAPQLGLNLSQTIVNHVIIRVRQIIQQDRIPLSINADTA